VLPERMSAGNEMDDDRVERLERSAVALSLWVGGAGLAALKLSVYLATGSVLIRATMFDSLGDVFSSLIMALTQWKVNDKRDMHAYPLGKGRFAPLGVLFFCAFMCSTMLSMAMDSLQSLVSSDSEDNAPDGPDVQAAVGSAMHDLFKEHPRLRLASWPTGWEALIAQYTAAAADAGGSDNDVPDIDPLSTALLCVCVATKIVLFFWCRYVGSKRDSEIVAALRADHFNDIFTNSMVIATMLLMHYVSGTAYGGRWLSKVDPAVSLVLSLYIVRGWVQNAMEQFSVLSDQRTEDIDAEAISQATNKALEGSPLELQRADIYRVGDRANRVQLELRPNQASAESEKVAALFAEVEGSIRRASSEVSIVDVRLRSFNSQDKDNNDWVKEYRR